MDEQDSVPGGCRNFSSPQQTDHLLGLPSFRSSGQKLKLIIHSEVTIAWTVPPLTDSSSQSVTSHRGQNLTLSNRAIMFR